MTPYKMAYFWGHLAHCGSARLRRNCTVIVRCTEWSRDPEAWESLGANMHASRKHENDFHDLWWCQSMMLKCSYFQITIIGLWQFKNIFKATHYLDDEWRFVPCNRRQFSGHFYTTVVRNDVVVSAEYQRYTTPYEHIASDRLLSSQSISAA